MWRVTCRSPNLVRVVKAELGGSSRRLSFFTAAVSAARRSRQLRIAGSLAPKPAHPGIVSTPRTPLYMARAGGVSDLPDADRRVIAVAANSLFERAFGRPKIGAEEKDDLVAQLEAMPPEERVRTARQLLEEGRRYCRHSASGSASKAGKAEAVPGRPRRPG